MSSINPNNIDGTYPIAGQDNDSQGFRDNFTNIKNNFTFSKAEIEDLQNNAILKSPLSGTTLNNNLNNAQLIGAQMLKTTETINDIGIKSGAVSISWQDAQFQLIETSGAITLTINGWATSGFFNRIRLAVNVTDIAHTLTFAAGSYVGLDVVQGVSGNTITFAETGTYYFELSTYDAGGTIGVEDVFRNYTIDNTSSNFTTANITSNVDSSSTTTGALIVAGGIGIGGNINVGGNLTVTDAAIVGSTLDVTGTITGDVTGNVTGNVNGNLTGNVTGNVTGTITGNVNGNLTGDVTGNVTGDVTGDVTGNLIGSTTVSGSISTTGNITTSGGKIGYDSGNGGTVTQLTNKTTSTTLNATTGTITLATGSIGANSAVTSFTFINNKIDPTDILLLQHQNGGTIGGYTLTATPGTGSAEIYVTNITHGALNELPVIRFAVIKSVNS